jgi:hypothetical protein
MSARLLEKIQHFDKRFDDLEKSLQCISKHTMGSESESQRDFPQRVERTLLLIEEYFRELGNKGNFETPINKEAGQAARARAPSISEQAILPSLGDLKSSLDIPFRIDR